MILCLLWCLCADLEPGPDSAPSPEPGTLVIRAISGPDVKPAKRDVGNGAFALYDSADSFEVRQPLRVATREIVDGISVWSIDDLPEGDYAIAYFHDRNANATLDRNKLGVPKEPYGFSEDARSTFGPPSFEAARFHFDGTSTTIEFAVR